jgi:hypothetical protein
MILQLVFGGLRMDVTILISRALSMQVKDFAVARSHATLVLNHINEALFSLFISPNSK